jgi:hypothetical protein
MLCFPEHGTRVIFQGLGVALILAISEGLTHFQHIYPDSVDYIALAYAFEGGLVTRQLGSWLSIAIFSP